MCKPNKQKIYLNKTTFIQYIKNLKLTIVLNLGILRSFGGLSTNRQIQIIVFDSDILHFGGGARIVLTKRQPEN